MKKMNVSGIHRTTGKMEVYLFNVGQGDHILLKFPGGQYGIIDFYYDASNKMPEPPALSYFRDLKRKLPKEEFDQIVIAFLCVSHVDLDHVKGISKMVNWLVKEGVLIEDIWMGAARTEEELYHNLREKVDDLFTRHPEEQSPLIFNKELYDENLLNFLDNFEKWKNGELPGVRYHEMQVGKGEYLVGIKSLRKPCPLFDIEVVNMGPLDKHLDLYYKEATFNLVKNVLLGSDKKGDADNNLLSHILRIQYGCNNMLFGGDTHKEIWEECLNHYTDPRYSYLELHGDIYSHFIKVSHHGSRHSSSPDIWQKVLPDRRASVLGISAGQHMGYKHPHDLTLAHIQGAKNKEPMIYATNVCLTCLLNSGLEIEDHDWYTEYLEYRKLYGDRDDASPYEEERADLMGKCLIEDETGGSVSKKPGLLAYIFEIPSSNDEPVRTRIALSRSIQPKKCFYQDHDPKLNKYCYEMKTARGE